ADYFDFERIEALKPAIEACGISTLSQSPMLGFHKQMDNRIKLLEEILVFFCVSKNVSVSCAYTQGKREQFSGFNRTLDAINNVFRKFSAFHDETGRLNVDGMNIISNDGSNKLNRS